VCVCVWHSYDVIKHLSKYIIQYHFSPVFTGTEMQKSAKKHGSYSPNKVACITDHRVEKFSVAMHKGEGL